MTDFLSWVPCADARCAPVSLQVHEISLEVSSHAGRCRKWHEAVQPQINAQEGRADRNWNWPLTIAPLVLFGHRHRGGRVFQITAGDEERPAAMIAVLENERWFADPDLPATFLWYLSTAPGSGLEREQDGSRICRPKLIGSAALDAAICVALDGCKGRLWLHAAPAGGDALLRWYAASGLAPIDPVLHPNLPGFGLGRRNDSRYFSLDEENAMLLFEKYSEYRVSP